MRTQRRFCMGNSYKNHLDIGFGRSIVFPRETPTHRTRWTGETQRTQTLDHCRSHLTAHATVLTSAARAYRS